MKKYLKEQDENIFSSQILEDLILGGLNYYLLAEELENLMGSIVADYKEKVVFEFDIGNSYEGRPIKAYAFMLGTTKELF
jgi:hypothetical protein